MKAFLSKQTGILGLTEDFAVLKEISKDGYYVYEVKYKVNPKKASLNKAFKVKITVSKEAPIKKTNLNFSTVDPQAMLKNVLYKAPQSKDLTRAFQANVILSKNSDITKRIPNDQTLSLTKNNGIETSALGVKKELRLASVSELNNQNVVMPVFQTNLFKKSETTPTAPNSITLREHSHELIFSKGIDPASIAVRSNTIASSAKVNAGVTVKQNIVAVHDRHKSLVESVLQKSVPNISTQFHLSVNDHIPVVVELPVVFIEIEEEVRIPIGAIGEREFFLIFELINSAGITVETIYNNVTHPKYVSAIKIPKEPPTVKFMPSGKVGKTILLIKQEDPYATGVNIYRKTLDKHSPQIDAQYTFIGKMSVKKGEDFKRFEDEHANFNPTIFRVVPYNDSGVMSSEFTSIVSKSEKPPTNIRVKKEIKPNFVSMAYRFEEHGLDLEIKDLPPGPIIMAVLRYDLTLKEQQSTMIGDFILLDGRGSAPLIVSDNSVKKEHIYEYICKLIYRDGQEVIGSNKLIVEYIPVTNNVVNTNVGPSKVIQEGTNLDVTFDIDSSLVETNIDLIRRAMQAQGLAGIFQEDIIKNKEKLQNLLGYRVVRTNLTTGEIEDFGIIIDTKFSDAKFGKIKGVKPVQPGFEYRYAISTYFRSPETLIPTFTRTVKTSTNNSYTFAPSKWYHPVTLFKGNIVSEKSLQANHAKSDFSHGIVGNITSVNVSLSKVLPSLYDANVSRVGNRLALIQWKVQGEISKIDHFIVILEMLGMRTIVGKSHNVSDGNYFQFIDLLDKGEHGALTYYILPVFYDYSRGTELQTNQVII
jgi:hypothetical protein